MPDGSTALERQILSQPEQLEAVLAEPIPASAAERLRGVDRSGSWAPGRASRAGRGDAAGGRTGRPPHEPMSFANRPPFAQGDGVILISHNAGTETAFAGAVWTMATPARRWS